MAAGTELEVVSAGWKSWSPEGKETRNLGHNFMIKIRKEGYYLEDFYTTLVLSRRLGVLDKSSHPFERVI